MNSRDMQVIGLCRFSYPAEGGFQVEHDTMRDRESFLYDPVRMEERFRTFEAFTLPAMQAQTDGDFTFVVLVGDSLPAPYRDRLEALLSPLPQARLVSRAPGPHRAVMKEVINDARDGRREPCLQFRMDDDDAVAVSYVECLREAAQDLRPLIRKNRHVAIDFNQGWIARPGAEGIAATPTVEALWTAALAISARPNVQNTIMNFGHSKLARFMPVVSLTGQDMFIRGHNDFNDSRQKKNLRQPALELLDAETETHFRRVFNVDADRVRALYA